MIRIKESNRLRENPAPILFQPPQISQKPFRSAFSGVNLEPNLPVTLFSKNRQPDLFNWGFDPPQKYEVIHEHFFHQFSLIFA
jgi:hypothetical protein